MHASLLRLIVCLAGLGAPALVRAEITLDYVMFADPELEPPQSPQLLDDRLTPLWRQALARPEGDLRRLAAEAVSTAHQRGFTVAAEARPELLAVLGDQATPDEVRWAAARALIVLEAQDAAGDLFAASQQAPKLRPLIEPQLADWRHAPLLDVLRARLTAEGTTRRDLMSAIDGIGRFADAESLESLLEFVRDARRPADVRLASARAAGRCATSGLESLAGELSATDRPIVDRLCAAGLLTRHDAPQARELLAAIAVDSEPSVAADALRTLYSIDPELVVPLAEGAIANWDANVRLEGLRCYATLPTVDRIAVLGRSLDDHHPRNRSFVREELFRHARQPEFDAAVRQAVVTALATDAWRAQEQAALLVGALDHEPAAPRTVELLESRRKEVMTTAAWTLRKLAVPETLPAMLDRATRESLNPTWDIDEVAPQVAHLFEGMALMNFQEADPLMRRHIPKKMVGAEMRGAAVWGLGVLHAGVPDEDLAKSLMERYLDTASSPSELPLVRRMSAVSIGRMKSAAQLEELKARVGPVAGHNSDAYSARWAILQISGEEIPLAEVPTFFDRGWFLEAVPY
ncbi:MAG: phycocyanin alpha phycocyanobilin lyase [Planctomyces sp.]|nr:phycocyanin alpha phycocyanobilin lyase [Planctomyces sp.]